MRAWIEMHLSYITPHSNLVALFMRAWIEIYAIED